MSDDQFKAIIDITALKARYFRFMDTKDWTKLQGVFAHDLVLDSREATGKYDDRSIWYGADAYLAVIAPMLQPLVTVHHGHTPEIEMLAEDRAAGVWAMEDKLWAPEGHEVGWRFLHGYGHYHETYTRLEGQWRIQTLRLTRLRVDIS